MYTPIAFSVTDNDSLLDFVASYPFATLVTATSAKTFVSHVPLDLDREYAPKGRLRGHFSRENPHWEALSTELPSLALFHGPHAYVSPTWYSTPVAVPTWNYAAVHATGTGSILSDPAETREVLQRLVERFEAEREPSWPNQLPDAFRSSMEAAIVAFELPIDQLEGKFKLSQNRSAADQRGVIEGLERAGGNDEVRLASFMKRTGG